MAMKLEPVLRLRDCDPVGGRWRVSALIGADTGTALPMLSATIDGGPLPTTNTDLGALSGVSFRRFDFDIAMTGVAQTVQYSVDGVTRQFTVPAKDTQPRFAYVSCNGFSSLKLMKSVEDKNALWSHMQGRHAKSPYHVLLMGGDQVYADSMWEMVDLLRVWNQLGWDDPQKGVLPNGLEAALLDHFVRVMYCGRWSQPEVQAMLGAIPTLMMWDDHDIMDGWGSYPDKWLDNPVYQTIFKVARRCFELFQLQGTMSDPVYITRTTGTYSQLYRFGTLAILAPDLRSERRLDQVVSPPSWEAIYAALDTIDGPGGDSKGPYRQLLVMSSIPVMHARFGQVETILGWVPGQQELEDDLHDHWSSRPHRGERLRLISRLLDFSEREWTRVTIVSGDVHVAAHASIVADRKDGPENANVLVQLTSSAVVHPAPPAIMRFALNHLFEEDEEIHTGITGHMEKMPGDERRYVAARNWLSLEPDDPGNIQNRIWANWYVEEDLKQPFTRVIHPVG